MTAYPEQENMLEKYRKMSNIDERFLSEVYYLKNEHITKQIESLLLSD